MSLFRDDYGWRGARTGAESREGRLIRGGGGQATLAERTQAAFSHMRERPDWRSRHMAVTCYGVLRRRADGSLLIETTGDHPAVHIVDGQSRCVQTSSISGHRTKLRNSPASADAIADGTDVKVMYDPGNSTAVRWGVCTGRARAFMIDSGEWKPRSRFY